MSCLRKCVGLAPSKASVTGLVAGFAAVAAFGVVGAGPASAASGASPQVAAPTVTPPLASLNDPSGTQGDSFGLSVAVAGGTAVVGDPGAYYSVSPQGNFSYSPGGSVYIYTKIGSGWVQTVTLTDPAATFSDNFGSSVAIDGPTIVVGADGFNGVTPGAAYVYTQGGPSGWHTTPAVTLNDPAATNNDLFGSSVAVDGSTIVVGAPQTPFDFSNPNVSEGAAYVYSAGGNGVWPSTPTASLNDPAATANDSFGASVAVEKNVVAVGTTNGDAAYLYVQGTGNAWPASPTTTMTDPAPTPNDCYGCSVALDEDTTLVVGADLAPIKGPFGYPIGAGAVYIYPKTSGAWSSPTRLTEPGRVGYDDFGASVAVDNGKLVVGADFANANGMAWEFIKGPGGWPTTPNASFADQINFGMDRFGSSVAVQGNATVIGAWSTYGSQYGGGTGIGEAYIFKA
jgi:hypothetical protein